MGARGTSRYVVGIDLGTTNSVLGFVDTDEGEAAPVRLLAVPQLVAPATIEERAALPSFLYLGAEGEHAAGALDLPFAPAPGRTWAVGEYAREHGWKVPMRLVSSAKSWLGHAGVDRTAALLPVPLLGPSAPPSFGGGPSAGGEAVDVPRVSPVEASARYLGHLRDVWDHAIAKGRPEHALARQEVLLTVPASFDAVARELTARAAKEAGLDVTLLEEPQAAFYSWLAHHGDRSGDPWRKRLRVGDLVLVCDVGGGTTDFSLIAVTEEQGTLSLARLAVGDHILLGGDNMDLALAASLQRKLAEDGTSLDGWQMRSLTHACRAAKEVLLREEAAGEPPASHPVTVLGRGRSVVGGAIKTELTREELARILVDGFFPACGPDERPRERRRMGLQELGLPFAADPDITRHLAKFLAGHLEGAERPTAVLFNGGVMKARLLRKRVVETLDAWSDDPEADLQVLAGTDFDLAVAHGAAYYGLVRRGRGVRIKGGTARSYYVGVESAVPAVPGMEPPLKAICVAPAGMEEGTETDVVAEGAEEFGLVVGEKAEFRFLSSTVRKGDRVGAVVEDGVGTGSGGEIEETAPLEAKLAPKGDEKPGQLVPVRLRARVTEVGTLEVECVARDGESWKLEFDVRGHER